MYGLVDKNPWYRSVQSHGHVAPLELVAPHGFKLGCHSWYVGDCSSKWNANYSKKLKALSAQTLQQTEQAIRRKSEENVSCYTCMVGHKAASIEAMLLEWEMKLPWFRVSSAWFEEHVPRLPFMGTRMVCDISIISKHWTRFKAVHFASQIDHLHSLCVHEGLWIKPLHPLLAHHVMQRWGYIIHLLQETVKLFQMPFMHTTAWWPWDMFGQLLPCPSVKGRIHLHRLGVRCGLLTESRHRCHSFFGGSAAHGVRCAARYIIRRLRVTASVLCPWAAKAKAEAELFDRCGMAILLVTLLDWTTIQWSKK